MQRGSHVRELERGLAEIPVLVLDQEERRLGVVELERDLGGSEPPRDRMEDRARLGAREHQRDVLAGVARQRRDAVAWREASRQLVGARVELRVRPGTTALLDRDPVGSDPGAVPDDPVDRVLDSSEELRR